MRPEQISAGLLELERNVDRLSRGGFCADVIPLFRDAFRLLTPPDQVSTTQCAEESRRIPTKDGSVMLWSSDLTPYMAGPQDALDDPKVEMVAVLGPARSGKSVGALNHLHKRLRFGPLTDVLWYLPGAEDVDHFVDTEVQTYFELHPDIAAKIGKRATDNKRKFKRIAGRSLTFAAANPRTVRARQAPFIVADEVDAFHSKLRTNMIQQIRIRGRAFGKQRKAYVCSHPDMGVKGGIYPVWREGTRGLWYQPCPHCDDWSSPCPPAEKRMTLHYAKRENLPEEEMLAEVGRTAALKCPHCGSLISEDERKGMVARGKWVFHGQVIDEQGNVAGEPIANATASFWIHGTMSPFISLGELAVEYESALLFFRKTADETRLKEVTVKSLGEVYEGADEESQPIEAQALRKRLRDPSFEIGELPEWTLFLTAAVDVGGSKFDAAVFAHGLDGERALVDRFIEANVRPGERAEDWNWIVPRLLRKVYPFADDASQGMMIGSVAIDTGGVPGVTWNARTFARKAMLLGHSGQNGYRVRLVKGGTSKTAEIIRPREVSKDDKGRAIEPSLTEYDLNVHRLKLAQARQIRTTTPGPGFWHIAYDAPYSVYEELCAEVLVDDDWERRGANETWDLGIYAEIARQLLGPERIQDWSKAKAPWARRIRLNEGHPGTESRDGSAQATNRVSEAARRRAQLNMGANSIGDIR